VPTLRPEACVRLSRHVVLRPGPDGLLLESALVGRVAPIASQAVLRLLFSLARPVRVADLLEVVEDSRRPAVLGFLNRWWQEGVLTSVREDGRTEEDAALPGAWEPHDLFFHTRSRRGRTPASVGATYPLRGVFPPEPVFREGSGGGRTLILPHPSLARLKREDPSLTCVLEARRSRYSLMPLTVEALGELLFRAFRVTSVHEYPDDETRASKVYPSGGSLHSLELYVVPWACAGVERGVWRYDAREHALMHVCGCHADVEALLEEARVATGGLGAYPPVLLIFTSRFQRVAWKYASMAYATILKEVGGVFQTLYLAATAMGLSPCALGAGDSDRFARVAGIDYYRETSVGEFIVGGPGGLTGLELARRIEQTGRLLGAEPEDAQTAPARQEESR
jgi:oxazoline/thiazoline dehydrogenase